MGSVQDYQKCEKCGGVRFVDFYYKTGEEYSFCQRCGESRNYQIQRNDQGEALFDTNGYLKFEEKIEKGYGTFAIVQKNGVGQVGSFNQPIPEETIQEFKKIFEGDEIDTERSYLAAWENGQQKLLYGKAIPDINTLGFDEWNQKMMESYKKEQEMDEALDKALKEAGVDPNFL